MERNLSAAATRGLNQWPLMIVVAGVMAGLGLAYLGHWRMGSVTIGVFLLLGAAERALLPPHVVGLLQVRSRGFDVAVMTFLGVAIVVLAFWVPSWE